MSANLAWLVPRSHIYEAAGGTDQFPPLLLTLVRYVTEPANGPCDTNNPDILQPFTEITIRQSVSNIGH